MKQIKFNHVNSCNIEHLTNVPQNIQTQSNYRPPIVNTPTISNRPPITNTPINRPPITTTPINRPPITTTSINRPSITNIISPYADEDRDNIVNVYDQYPFGGDIYRTNIPTYASPITNIPSNRPPITNIPSNRPPITNIPSNRPPITNIISPYADEDRDGIVNVYDQFPFGGDVYRFSDGEKNNFTASHVFFLGQKNPSDPTQGFAISPFADEDGDGIINAYDRFPLGGDIYGTNNDFDRDDFVNVNDRNIQNNPVSYSTDLFSPNNNTVNICLSSNMTDTNRNLCIRRFQENPEYLNWYPWWLFGYPSNWEEFPERYPLPPWWRKYPEIPKPTEERFITFANVTSDNQTLSIFMIIIMLGIILFLFYRKL